jgi:hypothetical protein
MVAFTLLPAALLAACVAAIPTSGERHAARIARRQGMPKQPYVGISPLVSANGTENESYSSNWAGGVYNYPAVCFILLLLHAKVLHTVTIEQYQGRDGDFRCAEAKHSSWRQLGLSLLCVSLGWNRRRQLR